MGHELKTKKAVTRDELKTHKDLDVWNKAMDFTEQLYVLTKTFPKEEQFGLTSQIRRSAVSIPSNIAEGAARNSDKEFLQFLYISLGSLAEVETQLLLAKRLNYFAEDSCFDSLDAIRKMLIGLIKFVRRKIYE